MDLTLASRRKRLVGAIIDGAITIPVQLLGVVLLNVHSYGGPSWFGQHAAIAAFSFVVFMMLHGFLLLRRGQTIGKAVIGMRIVDESGELVGPARLLGFRYLLPALIYVIPGLGGLAVFVNALFIFRKDKRCIHDHFARSFVVDVT